MEIEENNKTMSSKDIPPILITYCLNSGLAETREEVSSYLAKQMERFLPLFTNDGYSPKEAERELMHLFVRAIRPLHYASSQRELEQRISDEECYDLEANYISKEGVLEALPAIVGLSPFPLDVERLIKHTITGRINSYMTKSLMQYLNLWRDQTSPAIHQKIFKEVGSANYSPKKAYFLSLYADRILEYFSEQPQIIQNVFKAIAQLPETILPLVSVLPPEQIPNSSLQQEAKRWLTEDITRDRSKSADKDKAEITLERIATNRHLHPYCGICDMMEVTHKNTLFNKKSGEGYGNTNFYGRYGNAVLIYVQDQLIGSLKFSGEQSMVSFSTIKDEKGRHPLVLGGVYAISEEVREEAEKVRRTSRRRFPKMYLNRLAVRPLRFFCSQHSDGFFQNRQFAERLKMKRKRFGNRTLS